MIFAEFQFFYVYGTSLKVDISGCAWAIDTVWLIVRLMALVMTFQNMMSMGTELLIMLKKMNRKSEYLVLSSYGTQKLSG